MDMDRPPARPRLRARSVWLMALGLLATSCAAMAPPVTGYLVSRGGSRPERLDQAVVYVESEGLVLDRRFPARADRTSLTFVGGALEPAVLVAKAGTWLEIWNSDSVFHQPFSRSRAAPFPGRSVGPRAAAAVQLRSKGVAQIYCQLHEGESAEVLVLPNGAWTRPDSSGAFTLPPLPPGHYVLHAWHPRLGERTLPVELDRSGSKSLKLRF